MGEAGQRKGGIGKRRDGERHRRARDDWRSKRRPEGGREVGNPSGYCRRPGGRDEGVRDCRDEGRRNGRRERWRN